MKTTFCFPYSRGHWLLPLLPPPTHLIKRSMLCPAQSCFSPPGSRGLRSGPSLSPSGDLHTHSVGPVPYFLPLKPSQSDLPGRRRSVRCPRWEPSASPHPVHTDVLISWGSPGLPGPFHALEPPLTSRHPPGLPARSPDLSFCHPPPPPEMPSPPPLPLHIQILPILQGPTPTTLFC